MFLVWKYLKQIEKYRGQYERPPRTITWLHPILILHPFKGIQYSSWVLLTFLPLHSFITAGHAFIVWCISINNKYSYLYDINCHRFAYIYFVVTKSWGLIPGLGRTPEEGDSKPLQYSCLENPMDGGAWWAPVYGVAKSQTRLSNSHFHFFSHFPPNHVLLCKFSLQ